MATQTTNYGLKKPDYNDSADIGVINSNMDIIDSKMKEIEDAGGGGGTPITVDSELSDTSTNPVQNKVITEALGTTNVLINEVAEKISNLERSVVTLPVSSDVTYTSLIWHDVVRSFGVANIRYQILGYVGIGNYQTIGTLPNGYKPNSEMLKRICVANNVFGYFRIKTNGEVQINIANGTTTSLYINEVFLI